MFHKHLIFLFLTTYSHRQIQRLSVILFLEKLLPSGMTRLTGRRLYYHKRKDSHGGSRTDQGEMRYVITDTKKTGKLPKAVGVDRNMSQDRDEVDTDFTSDGRKSAVIVSCPDDDTPSQPPTPTESLGDADFLEIQFFHQKDGIDSSSKDSEPYVELDLIRKCPQRDSTLDGLNGRFSPLSTSPVVNDPSTDYASCRDLRENAQRTNPARTHPDRQQDETEYMDFSSVDGQDLRRPAIYSDPQWVSLLQSIRTFDERPKTLRRQSSYMMTLKKPLQCTLNRGMSRKIRNDFIFEGREKSVDDIYWTVDDVEAEQEHYDPNLPRQSCMKFDHCKSA